MKVFVNSTQKDQEGHLVFLFASFETCFSGVYVRFWSSFSGVYVRFWSSFSGVYGVRSFLLGAHSRCSLIFHGSLILGVPFGGISRIGVSHQQWGTDLEV